MWTLVDNVTNTVTVPTEGIISVTKPDSVLVKAFVNDAVSGVHHIHVKAGDTVYFKTENTASSNTPVVLDYAGTSSTLIVPAGVNLHKEEDKMDTDAVNLFANPYAGSMGGAIGGGLGAGVLGGVLGGALLGNNGGILGNRNVGFDGRGNDYRIDPWQNQANMSLMAGIGEVKAAIPAAEGQVQLALAGAQMNVTNAVTAGTGAVIGAVSAFEGAVMNNLNMQTQMNQKGFADTTSAVVAAGTTNLLATKDLASQSDRNSWAITQAISNDGEKTRALIQSIDKTNDSRAITALANEVTELRNEGRIREATGNITISNTNTAAANQAQLQAQAQAQQLGYLTNQLTALIQQNQHIQQGVLNIGSGTVSGNSQNAANTRVS